MEKTHGGYHNAIGKHARDIATGKKTSISKLNFIGELTTAENSSP